MESELGKLTRLVSDLIEKVVELEATIEELNEKITDLQLTANSGFTVEQD